MTIIISFHQLAERLKLQLRLTKPILADLKLCEVLTPLPPLKEQQAIVKKANALMALCDQAEHQLEPGQSQVED